MRCPSSSRDRSEFTRASAERRARKRRWKSSNVLEVAIVGHCLFLDDEADHERAAKLRDELSRLDPGESLLAQVENFQQVPAGKPPKEGDK